MKLDDALNPYVKEKITKQDLISEDVNEIKMRLKGFVQIHEDNYKDIDIGI